MTTPTTQREADEWTRAIDECKAIRATGATGEFRAGATACINVLRAAFTVASPEAPAAATDQPSAGQVDLQDYFEAWAKSHGGLPLDRAGDHLKTDDGLLHFPTYKFGRTEIAWRAWANSRASLAPTAPQAANPLATEGERLRAEARENIRGARAALGKFKGPAYQYTPTDCAPQAATTASASGCAHQRQGAFSRINGPGTCWKCKDCGTITDDYDAPVQAAQPALPAEQEGLSDSFIQGLLVDLARRGASVEGIRLAAQIFGAGACERCGYRKIHCRCVNPDLAAPGAAQTTDKGQSHE